MNENENRKFDLWHLNVEWQAFYMKNVPRKILKNAWTHRCHSVFGMHSRIRYPLDLNSGSIGKLTNNKPKIVFLHSKNCIANLKEKCLKPLLLLPKFGKSKNCQPQLVFADYILNIQEEVAFISGVVDIFLYSCAYYWYSRFHFVYRIVGELTHVSCVRSTFLLDSRQFQLMCDDVEDVNCGYITNMRNEEWRIRVIVIGMHQQRFYIIQNSKYLWFQYKNGMYHQQPAFKCSLDKSHH